MGLHILFNNDDDVNDNHNNNNLLFEFQNHFSLDVPGNTSFYQCTPTILLMPTVVFIMI
jgi:hypothetical protein